MLQIGGAVALEGGKVLAEKEHNAQEAQEAREKAEELVKTIVVPLEGAIEPGGPGWAEAVEAAGGLVAAMQRAAESVAAIIDGVQTALDLAAIERSTRAAFEHTQSEFAKLAAVMEANEQDYRKFIADANGPLADLPRLSAIAAGMGAMLAGVTGFLQVTEDLGEYLEAELDKPDYEGMTMRDMMQPANADDPEGGTIWERIIQAASDAMAAADPDRYAQMLEGAMSIAEALEDAAPAMVLPADEQPKPETAVAALASVPNGEALNWLFCIAAAKGARIPKKKQSNRHESITVERGKSGQKLRLTRENTQKQTKTVIEISDADKFLKQIGKTFSKVLLFVLQKMTAQNFPLCVGFSLQELVDRKMYKNTDTARRAVKNFCEEVVKIAITGTLKKGKQTIKNEGGVLFYHYVIENGFVKIYVNENFNIQFIATYFTVFPFFAYALSTNAFSLVRYIFYLARQNTTLIKDKGTFTINLDTVRDALGLPAVDEVANRKYRQYIMEPIERAIEEIEEALVTVPEAKEYGFTMELHGTDTSNINEWLSGYLKIGLRNDFADVFIKLATKAEKDRARWEKAKLTEQAKLAAKEEAKAAKAQE